MLIACTLLLVPAVSLAQSAAARAEQDVRAVIASYSAAYGDNQETDVRFKRHAQWTIVHVNYTPARKPK
jgi:hypothetical protein